MFVAPANQDGPTSDCWSIRPAILDETLGSYHLCIDRCGFWTQASWIWRLSKKWNAGAGGKTFKVCQLSPSTRGNEENIEIYGWSASKGFSYLMGPNGWSRALKIQWILIVLIFFSNSFAVDFHIFLQLAFSVQSLCRKFLRDLLYHRHLGINKTATKTHTTLTCHHLCFSAENHWTKGKLPRHFLPVPPACRWHPDSKPGKTDQFESNPKVCGFENDLWKHVKTI